MTKVGLQILAPGDVQSGAGDLLHLTRRIAENFNVKQRIHQILRSGLDLNLEAVGNDTFQRPIHEF